jgi:hypothetical protein
LSIKSQINSKDASSLIQSDNLSTNFVEIPSCRIEDIDKALFNLFDRDLPLLYTHKNDTQRVPVVFSTGERFALIARKKPLRDRSNALILPVISISRTSIQMASEMGGSVAPDIPLVIKKQISSEDQLYQRLLNKSGFQNSDDLVSPSSFIDVSNQAGSQPGRIATRRPGAGTGVNQQVQAGNLFSPEIGKNLIEIYEMPPPVYLTVEYAVTIWTQYMQEMNNLIAAMARESHFHAVPSYRIETDKGYYFVAYFDRSFSNQSNFEDFSEEERLVRSSINVKVQGYIVGDPYKAAPNQIRRYVSAPEVSFEAILSNDEAAADSYSKIASGDPDRFLLENTRSSDEPLPGQSIGARLTTQPEGAEALIGGTSNAVNEKFVRVESDPFNSSKVQRSILVTKTKSKRKGETVYREIL